jgi:hypothetical protein
MMWNAIVMPLCAYRCTLIIGNVATVRKAWCEMRRRIFNAMVKCFNDHHLKYLWVERGDETRLFTQVPMKNGDLLCMSRIREEKNEFVFSLYYEVTVPESKRQEVAELITMINEGVMIGSFKMEDDEVCFRTGIAGADPPLTSAEIRHLLLISLATADHYLPALMAVIREDELPKGAMARVESAAV